jgi:hypothetical protein
MSTGRPFLFSADAPQIPSGTRRPNLDAEGQVDSMTG